jgi:hypothetical protein
MAIPMLGGMLGGGDSGGSNGSDDDVNNFNINIGGTMSDDDVSTSKPSDNSGGGGILGSILGAASGSLSSAMSGRSVNTAPGTVQVPSVLPTTQASSGFATHDDLAPQVATLLPTLANIDSSSGFENVAKILSTPRPMLTLTVASPLTNAILYPTEFFNLPPIKNRLQYFRGATFTMCMKVHVTANAFCSGLSMVKFVPFLPTSALTQSSRQFLPGDFIDLNSMTDYVLKIPYHAPYRMFDVNTLLNTTDQIAGIFHHYIYNDGPEPISYKVFFWLEDLQLFYPVIPIEDEPEPETRRARPVRVIPQGFKNKSVTESGHRLVIAGSARLDDVQGLPSNIKILNPTPVTTLIDDACPDDFASLLTRPSFLSIDGSPSDTIVHKLEASADLFFQDDFRFLTSRYSHTAVSMIPFFFQYWACSYEITFKFYKTQFHKGLLSFAFVPLTLNPPDIDYADHFHEILDLSVADSVTLRIPFTSDSSRFILGDSPGTLVCRQVVPLSAPDTVSASLSYTVSVRACEDLVFSLPNLNPALPPIVSAPVPVEPQGLLGPDMPIPPEYNAAGDCSISSYFTFAQRHLTDIFGSYFFTFPGTNTSRTLIMAPHHCPTSGRGSFYEFSRTNYLASCFYGSRCELVLDGAERLFIYDKYGQTPPPRALVPYLSNLKFTYTFAAVTNQTTYLQTNVVAANFQGFYQWFIPDVIRSNQEWYAQIAPLVGKIQAHTV